MIEVGFIYVLKDPRDGAIRYCGQTAYGVRTRMWKHCSDARKFRRKRHLANWLCSLLDIGLLPLIQVIEEVPLVECFSGPILRDPKGRPSRAMEKMERDLVAARLHAREIFHIARLRSEGHDLTNATIGGQGTLGRKASPEAIQKTRLAHLGTKRTPEQIERMRASQLRRSKGSYPRGADGSGAKLSDEQVREIFVSEEKNLTLAARYGLTSSYVAQIKCGHRRVEATSGLERSPRGKGSFIGEDIVRAIRSAEGHQYEIAERFGVSKAYVSCIKRGVMRQEVENGA